MTRFKVYADSLIHWYLETGTKGIFFQYPFLRLRKGFPETSQLISCSHLFEWHLIPRPPPIFWQMEWDHSMWFRQKPLCAAERPDFPGGRGHLKEGKCILKI